jgi:hypothetical protein
MVSFICPHSSFVEIGLPLDYFEWSSLFLLLQWQDRVQRFYIRRFGSNSKEFGIGYRIMLQKELFWDSTDNCVAEPPELFRFKCVSHRYTADNNSTHFKRNNPLVRRVSARYNHGSTGSKQVYLTWRWVYNHSTAHQLLIYRYANIITDLVQNLK